MISNVVVGIPARDEADRVVGCLRSVLRAADSLSPDIDVVVVLAADACIDDTDLLAADCARLDGRVQAISGEWRSAGGARAAAVTHGLATLVPTSFNSAEATWIATTDADSVVADDWLRRQLRYADHGADAVAGIVELLDERGRTEELMQAFNELYLVDRESHAHVHGANLGVRASAYAAAGGFPSVELSEDHALWDQLGRLGFRRASPLDVCVATSPRLCGRAVGGFADTIAAALQR